MRLVGTPKLKSEVQIGQLQVRADVQPKSFNKENRTVDVVMSTGYRGQRMDWMSGDSYMEELDISDAAIRKDRLDAGMPVLANHSSFTNSDKMLPNIGVVEAYRIENGQLMGSLKMSRTEDVASILQDIEDGIIRSVSLGYRVHKYIDVSVPTDEMRIFRAVDWEPMEVSLVSIPFDPKAVVRNAPDSYVVKVETKNNEGEKIMSEVTRSAEEPSKVEAAPEVVPAPAAEQAPEVKEEPAKAAEEEKKEDKPEVSPSKSEEEVRSAERTRSSVIIEACRKVSLGMDFAHDLINKGVEVEAARAAIIDAVADRGAKPLSNKIEITVGEEKVDIQKRGIVNAIMHRSNPAKVQLTEEGRAFRGMRMHQIAAEVLEVAGVKTRGMTPSEIASKALSHDFHIRAGAMGTTDLTNLLADVANKTLRQGYEEAPQSFLPFVRKVTAPDFKNINRVMLGEYGNLAKVNEHGDLQYGSISDGKEAYKIYSYAKGLKLTKQALVNDDLDGLSRLAMLMGRAASRLESDLVYSILLSNAVMADSVALFHATHANLGTGGAISETTLTEMKKLGRKQTGLDGAKLNLQYKHLIVSPELEVTALKQIGQIVPNQASQVNPFVGQFNLIVDARVSAGTASPSSSGTSTVWFAACDPAEIDTIELATLEGQSGPMIVEDVDFDSQGIKMAVWHDVGAKAIDSRGLFKNVGA